MLRWFRHHLSYANVTSTIAIFLALGGGAAYANHLIVNSSDVVNEGLTGTDIRNNSLTGADIQESSLGGQAFARVNRDGTLDKARSKNVVGVTNAVDSLGTRQSDRYCFDVSFPPTSAVASTKAFSFANPGTDSGVVIIQTAAGSDVDAQCPATHRDASAFTHDSKSQGRAIADFFIVFLR